MSIEQQAPSTVVVRRGLQSPIGIFHTPDIDLLAYPHHYAVTLHVEQLVGGTPNNPDVAEGWLAKKLGVSADDQIRAAAAQVMLELGIKLDEAIDKVKKQRVVNSFKQDEGGLYLDARCAKAALREAVGVAVGSGKVVQRGWGYTQKWINAFFAEHVFVAERRIPLGRTEPDGVNQQFVHKGTLSSIKYEQYCTEVDLSFTVITDVDFDTREPNGKNDKPFWPLVWRTGEMQGIGASRSQGFGTYVVTRWEKVSAIFDRD